MLVWVTCPIPFRNVTSSLAWCIRLFTMLSAGAGIITKSLILYPALPLVTRTHLRSWSRSCHSMIDDAANETCDSGMWCTFSMVCYVLKGSSPLALENKPEHWIELSVCAFVKRWVLHNTQYPDPIHHACVLWAMPQTDQFTSRQ